MPRFLLNAGAIIALIFLATCGSEEPDPMSGDDDDMADSIPVGSIYYVLNSDGPTGIISTYEQASGTDNSRALTLPPVVDPITTFFGAVDLQDDVLYSIRARDEVIEKISLSDLSILQTETEEEISINRALAVGERDIFVVGVSTGTFSTSITAYDKTTLQRRGKIEVFDDFANAIAAIVMEGKLFISFQERGTMVFDETNLELIAELTIDQVGLALELHRYKGDLLVLNDRNGFIIDPQTITIEREILHGGSTGTFGDQYFTVHDESDRLVHFRANPQPANAAVRTAIFNLATEETIEIETNLFLLTEGIPSAIAYDPYNQWVLVGSLGFRDGDRIGVVQVIGLSGQVLFDFTVPGEPFRIFVRR